MCKGEKDVMPYLFDEFGKSKEVSSGAFYLTGLVDQLFDSVLDILGGRIDVTDFRRNWYQLVPFILFVIRLAHSRAGRDLHTDIQSYVSDQGNPDSYLHRFNNPEYASLQQYDPVWLADTVRVSYLKYWELFTACSANGKGASFALNEYLGHLLAAGAKDQPNLHDTLSFLTDKFAKGEAALFEG
jgi:hypothetical protein